MTKTSAYIQQVTHPYIISTLIAVALLSGIIGYKTNKGTVVSDTSSTPSVQDTVFCKPENLEANISLEGAAGTTYGTISLKNISQRPCYIDGDNVVDVRYDVRTVKNIALKPTGKPENSLYELAQGQTLYSRVKYPNGAQCGNETKDTRVLFAYRITQSAEVIFKNQEGNEISIPVCANNVKTNIEVGYLSTTQNLK